MTLVEPLATSLGTVFWTGQHRQKGLLPTFIMAEQQLNNPAKRRRLSLVQNDQTSSAALFLELPPHIHVEDQNCRRDKENSEICEDTGISISSTSKLAGQTVAPFLAQHIPEQYAPLGGPRGRNGVPTADPNSKFCYRHRPDLKCRRQANEPSMDQLQHVSSEQLLHVCYVTNCFDRNSRPYRRVISRGLRMCGHYSRPRPPNIGSSCFKAS